MTVERMDLLSPKEIPNGKTIFRKCGVAWPRKDGQPGYTLELEMIPLPDKEGRVRIIMMPPRDQAATGQYQPAAPSRPTNSYAQNRPRAVSNGGNTAPNDLNDDVPF